MKSRPPSRRQEHLTDLELAELADSSAPAPDLAAGHLAACRRCMAIYAEFVHVRAAEHAQGGQLAAPPEWIRQGLAAGVEKQKPVRVAPTWRPFRGSFALAVAAAVFCLVGGTWGVDQVRLYQDHQRLATRLRQDSYGGLLYGEDFRPVASGVRGAAPQGRSEEALADLARRSQRGPRSGDDAFWLVAGFLAHNDLDNADVYLRAGRRLAESDPRLDRLAAILAFKKNDLAAAAEALTTALEKDRSAANLYNLARVLRVRDDASRAAALEDEIRERFPASWVAALVTTTGQPGP